MSSKSISDGYNDYLGQKYLTTIPNTQVTIFDDGILFTEPDGSEHFVKNTIGDPPLEPQSVIYCSCSCANCSGCTGQS